MAFNFGVVPVKATEILYKDSRIEYSVISWMLPGTFEIASLKSMLNVMNNDYISIPT
jgi:hypothetical protein